MSSRPMSDNTAYKWRYFGSIALAFVGAAIGLRFPDFDQAFRLPPLMMHRSLLTHGFLLPLLLLIWTLSLSRKRPEGVSELFNHPHADPRLRLFSLGFCSALAAHLAFDQFPRAWQGFALVYAPFTGYFSALESRCWLFGSVIVVLYIACWLLRRKSELILAAVCVGAAYGITATYEPDKAVYALLLLALCAALAFVLPRPKVRGSNGTTSMAS